MGRLVRILNENGIEKFREYLDALRSGSIQSPPKDLLEDAWSSAKLYVEIEIENTSFQNRLEAGRYFNNVFQTLDHAKLERNVGLWSWMSLYYFDLLAPPKGNAKRRPGLNYRFILSTDPRLYYRHLLFGTYIAYKTHGEKAPLLLYSPLSQTNKFHLELFARQEFITNTEIIAAANYLYFDKRRNMPKKGAAAAARKPGTLFRFIDIMHQLDLTHDLYSMSKEEILELLPPEFDEWKS